VRPTGARDRSNSNKIGGEISGIDEEISEKVSHRLKKEHMQV
jgi:hypothetical protein